MLNSVAKIVLADRFDEFAQLHEQLLKDKASVVERDEFADYLNEDSDSEDLLWAVAHRNRRIEWIDWAGEEDPDQVKNFVQERMESLAGSKLDWAFLEEFEKSIDFEKLNRGDYIVKKISCIDSEIRTKGFLIATLDRGEDQYYPFVAAIDDFQGIDGVEIGTTWIVAWADL
jgi:hypothetical protein